MKTPSKPKEPAAPAETEEQPATVYPESICRVQGAYDALKKFAEVVEGNAELLAGLEQELDEALLVTDLSANPPSSLLLRAQMVWLAARRATLLSDHHETLLTHVRSAVLNSHYTLTSAAQKHDAWSTDQAHLARRLKNPNAIRRHHGLPDEQNALFLIADMVNEVRNIDFGGSEGNAENAARMALRVAEKIFSTLPAEAAR